MYFQTHCSKSNNKTQCIEFAHFFIFKIQKNILFQFPFKLQTFKVVVLVIKKQHLTRQKKKKTNSMQHFIKIRFKKKEHYLHFIQFFYTVSFKCINTKVL